MVKRILGGVALLAAACAAQAYELRVVYQSAGLVESSGLQRVTVVAEWEPGDDLASCTMSVDVEAGPFSQPIFTEATPGVDYQPVSGTVSLTVDGSTTLLDSDTLDVPVIDDDLVEGEQHFTARITGVDFVNCDDAVANIDGTEVLFPIVDDDQGSLTLSLAQPVVSVDEGAGSVSIQLTLTGAESIESGFVVVADWTLMGGSATFMEDYGGEGGGFLMFDEETSTHTVEIPIVDDDLDEGFGETFDFSLSNVEGMLSATEQFVPVAVPFSTTTVQIVDDDGPGAADLASEAYQVGEAAGSATISVRRVGGSDGEITAYYQAVGGTATAGQDFEPVSGSISWTNGDAADKTFDVPILDDTEAEGNETVLIRLSTDPEFAEFQEAVLTIIDDEGPSTVGFLTAAVAASEGDDEVVLTLVRSGSPGGAVSVDYATADGSAVAGEDYVASSGTVTWADGDNAEKTIVISLLSDVEEEDAEDFVVNLTNVTGPATLGSHGSVTITIGPDETRELDTISNLTPNQRVLARWFDRTCDRIGQIESPNADQQDLAAVCSELRSIGTDDASVREALDAINPEELMVSSFNALRLTSLQHGNLSQRMNALRNGATGLSLVGLNLDVGGQQISGRALQEMLNGLTGGGASADEPWGRWGGFINGRLATGDQDGSDSESGFDFDLYSVTLGVDYRIRPNLIVGVSAGFGSVDTDFAGGEGGMDIDSWNGSLYLTYFRDETFYLDALATYGENDYESRRQIAFGNINRMGLGETDGKQWSLGVGSGWDYSRGGVTFGPHVGAYYFEVDVDGFVERGAGGLSVAIDDQRSKSFTMNAGGHISYAWLTDWGVLIPNARLDWVHEFEDSRETLSFRFLHDAFENDLSEPSPTITLQGNRPDTDYFIWSLGLSAQFIHGLSGFVNYQAYAGYGDVRMREWSVGARWEKAF